MADFADGYKVIRELARNDWYGITVRELADRLGWEYQKTLRVLRDVESEGVCRCAENGSWRLSEDFLHLLTAARGSYLDRLNALTERKRRSQTAPIPYSGKKPIILPPEEEVHPADRNCRCEPGPFEPRRKGKIERELMHNAAPGGIGTNEATGVSENGEDEILYCSGRTGDNDGDRT